MSTALKVRNRRTALIAFGVSACMIGAAYAAVPLYRLFCQITGFGGTTQVATESPAQVLPRTITVRFNADTDPALPWRFAPKQREMKVQVGEMAIAFYRAHNMSSLNLTGTATYNVTPLKAGPVFNKVECFCFTEQRLAPGAEVEMPVSFFVDPAIADDPGLADVTTITLSYTIFRTDSDTVDAARTGQSFSDG